METIEDIVKEMRNQAQSWWDKKVPAFCDLHDHWMITADRIEAAHGESLRYQAELLAEYRAENARLKSAIKPVLDFHVTREFDPAKWISQIISAVRDAQRIYREGGVE